MALADSAVEDDGVNGCDWGAYESSMYDLTHLKFKDGEQPTYITIAPLTSRQKQLIEDMATAKKLRYAFRYGVTSIDGYLVTSPDGEDAEELPPVKRKDLGGVGPAITDGWLNKHNLATDFLQMVGLMVLNISEASAPLSRRSGPPSGAGQ